MNNIVSGYVGSIHLLSSILALIFGTQVLSGKKGSKLHRQVGYAYVASMFVLLISAFMLYEFSGSFGIFHIAAVLSSATLLIGMVPVFTRGPKWIIQHFSWMFWSVIGLYGALISEIFTRIFPSYFLESVAFSMAGVMALGAIGFWIKIPTWKQSFYSKLNNPAD